MTNKALLALAAAATVAGGAAAATGSSPEARIPFIDAGGIRNYHPEGRNTVYIEDRHRNWYRATLMGPCPELPFAKAIGFETRGTGTLDRFGAVLVRSQRCPIESLVRSEEPEPRKSGDRD